MINHLNKAIAIMLFMQPFPLETGLQRTYEFTGTSNVECFKTILKGVCDYDVMLGSRK